MKKLLILTILGFIAFASLARASEGRCEFYAQAAASEEAVLGFDEFQAQARLANYSMEILANGSEQENFIWALPADNLAIRVVTEFDGGQCAILEAYPVEVK